MEKEYGQIAVLHGLLNRYVQSAAVDGNGHLILTMTDGDRVDAGMVRGETGQIPQDALDQINAAIADAVRLAGGALAASGGTMHGDIRMDYGKKIKWGPSLCSVTSDGTDLMLSCEGGRVQVGLCFEDGMLDLLAENVSFEGAQVHDLACPEAPDDAATKDYVDHKTALKQDKLSSDQLIRIDSAIVMGDSYTAAQQALIQRTIGIRSSEGVAF